MPSTMVMGVNHVNLSTNLKNPAANTNARVSYPVSVSICPGPPGYAGIFSLVELIANGERGQIPIKYPVTRFTRVTFLLKSLNLNNKNKVTLAWILIRLWCNTAGRCYACSQSPRTKETKHIRSAVGLIVGS